MNVVLLLNCDAAYEKAGLRQAHNVLRQLCDNGNKVTIFGKWKRLNAHLNSRHAGPNSCLKRNKNIYRGNTHRRVLGCSG